MLLDYGESHYVGPIKGAQPNSEAWVDGYPHVGWLYLNAYFASAFQTGKFPTITKDQIFVWARPHPKDAITKDTVPRPRNWQLVSLIPPTRCFVCSQSDIGGGHGMGSHFRHGPVHDRSPHILRQLPYCEPRHWHDQALLPTRT